MQLLTTAPEVLICTLLFITLWSALHIHIRSHGPSLTARRLMSIHNRIQILLSLTLVFTNLCCHLPPLQALAPLQVPLKADSCRLPRSLFHHSKFYEYFDILLIVAQGSEVGLHFGFHHLTTPWYALARTMRDWEGWGVFAMLNGVHHTLMYGYFGGATWTKPVLTYTRNIQLICGILWDLGFVMGVVGSGEARLGNWVSIGLLSCYLVLHRRDVRMMEELETQDKKQS